MTTLVGPFGFNEYLQNVNDVTVKEIWNSFIEHENVFTLFPIDTIKTQKRVTKRITGQLPPVTTVKVGQEPTNPFVVPISDYEEGVFLTRDNWDTDKILLNDTQYIQGDPTKAQIAAYIEARHFQINNYFFNNDHVVGDINGFVGLKYRCAFPTVYGNNAGCMVQSTADLSDAGGSSTSALRFQRDVQLVLDRMGNKSGKGIICFVNPQAIRQITYWTKGAGQAGGFTTSKDAFDRECPGYKDLIFVSVGYQAPSGANNAQTTPVIDSTQDCNGWSIGDIAYNSASVGPAGAWQTGALFSSAYFVWGGVGKFETWQMGDPEMVRERIPGTRKYRIMFDMTVGLYQPHTHALGRLFGFKLNGIAGD